MAFVIIEWASEETAHLVTSEEGTMLFKRKVDAVDHAEKRCVDKWMATRLHSVEWLEGLI